MRPRPGPDSRRDPSLERLASEKIARRLFSHAAGLNFLPDPHGQGSLRPTFLPRFRTGSCFRSPEFWARGDRGFLSLLDIGLGCRCEFRRRGLVDRLRAIKLPARAQVREEFGVKALNPEDQVGHLSEMPFHISARSSCLPACIRPSGLSARTPEGRRSCADGPSRGGVPSSSSRGSGAARPSPSPASRTDGSCRAR